jgi:glycosyltransferase involved in cell wall biosynthesis
MIAGRKVVIVMPAYNAAKTLEKTYRDIPLGCADEIILVDDVSRDDTVAVARNLGLRTLVHRRNRGYGGNQKTCYDEALRLGADIVVMLHPDYQYDSTKIPRLVEPIVEGQAEVVLGSRFLGPGPKQGGMPSYKIAGNRFLTELENRVLGLRLSEYHTGLRAFRGPALRSVPYQRNSEGFLFDQEILVQLHAHRYRITEIPIPTRYFDEASSVDFATSVRYGMGVLALMLGYYLYARGMRPAFGRRLLSASPAEAVRTVERG